MNVKIEQLSFMAWPAIETIEYDNWTLRFANGLTKRSNSVNPIGKGHLNLEKKIAYCERFYGERGFPALFKIYDVQRCEALERMLRYAEYTKLDPTHVMLLKLENISSSGHSFIQFEEVFSPEWINGFIEAIGLTLKSDIVTYQQLFQSIQGDIICATLYEGQAQVAYAYGHICDGYMGLFDIFVKREYRGQGYGRKLLNGLLEKGQQKAEYCYLQVVWANYKAVKLYESTGFKTLYRYWYRKKENV